MTDTPIDREAVEGLIAEVLHASRTTFLDDPVPPQIKLAQAACALLAAKEAAEAKIDACKVYLKDHQNPADRLAQNHREICSLLEMLAKDRKRAEAAEAKLAVAVEGLERAAHLAEDGFICRRCGKVFTAPEGSKEDCCPNSTWDTIPDEKLADAIRATLAQIQKEGTDNDG